MSAPRLFSMGLLVVASSAFACGQSPAPADAASSDSGSLADVAAMDVASVDAVLSEDAPPPEPVDVQGECNSVEILGPPAPVTFDSALPPPMTGGTIMDGTYVLTSAVGHGRMGTAMGMQSTTLRITGARWELASMSTRMDRVSLRVEQTGPSTLRSTVTCPTNTPGIFERWTASGTTLRVLDQSLFLLTFTRR
jgi:hypothetical protein